MHRQFSVHFRAFRNNGWLRVENKLSHLIAAPSILGGSTFDVKNKVSLYFGTSNGGGGV